MDEETSLLVSEENINTLIKEIFNTYGYDFEGYSKVSLCRRISRLMILDKIPSVAELQFKLLKEEEYFNHFLEEITVNVTEMFRDPLFYKSLKENVFSQLATYPLIRIWHAGCSTGEEVYSMAILLKEAGLLDKTLIYATDINQHVLEKAQAATFSIDPMSSYTQNYIKAGGNKDFSSYYTAKYGKVLFNKELQNRVVFSTHNLVADQSFNEFNLIVCRNVFIYFNRDLQNKVTGLFNDSLTNLGFLALGNKESISFTSYNDNFRAIDYKQKIWQKIK